MLGIGAVLPAVMLVLAAFVLPESPRWLVARGRRLEALESLESLGYAEGEREELVHAIELSIAEEEEIANDTRISWHALLVRPSPAIRRMLVVGCGVAVSQQLVGIDAVQVWPAPLQSPARARDLPDTVQVWRAPLQPPALSPARPPARSPELVSWGLPSPV